MELENRRDKNKFSPAMIRVLLNKSCPKAQLQLRSSFFGDAPACISGFLDCKKKVQSRTTARSGWITTGVSQQPDMRAALQVAASALGILMISSVGDAILPIFSKLATGRGFAQLEKAEIH